MSQAGKRRGAQFEVDVLKWLREHGFSAERLRLSGRLDEGDLAVTLKHETFVIEAKAERPHNFSGAVTEVMEEVENYARARRLDRATVTGLTVHKRPGKPIGQAYVVTTLDEFFSH